MLALVLVLALAAQDVPAPSDPAPSDPAPSDPAPSDPAPSDPAPAPAPAGEPSQPDAARSPGTSPGAPREEAASTRAVDAAWTVAGASAAGFVGGALFAVPLMLSQPFGIEVGLALGLPSLALGAAFGAFVAELGSARLSTSFAVSGIAGGGALLGSGAGLVAGFGIGTLAQTKSNDPAPLLGAIAGGALGGIGGAALSGGLGALWLTPDER